MTDNEQEKAAFAAFLIAEPLGPSRALDAACRLYPEQKDRGVACQIAAEWPKDPFVISMMAEYGEVGGTSRTPTKSEVIEQLWKLAKDDKVMAKDRVAAAFMVAKVLKYVDSGDDVERKWLPRDPVYKITPT